MISSELIWALGYKGACIMLSGDWRSNRHILKRNDVTLCGLRTCTQKSVMTNGRFIGYKPGSITETYGFYGSGRCKECLTRWLRHRLSPQGRKQVRLHFARIALRLPVKRL